MFDFIYLKQEEGWQPDRSVNITHTNPFFIQQEQGLIISPLRAMEDVSKVQHLNTNNLTAGIRNKKSH